jgi:hypothetical protein
MKTLMDGAGAAHLWQAFYRVARRALAPLPHVPQAHMPWSRNAGMGDAPGVQQRSRAYREGYGEKLKLWSGAASPYPKGSIEHADWCRGYEDATVERSL